MSKKELTAREMQSMGGKARAKSLTAKQRQAIASTAASSRWDRISPEERSEAAKRAYAKRKKK